MARIARAAARTSVGYGPAGVTPWGQPVRLICSGALDALGRLSPELQRAALHVSGYWTGPVDAPFGARDLDWAAIAAVHRQMASDRSGRVRAAWSAGRGLQAALGSGRVFAPAFSALPGPLAVRICRGEAPVALAGGVLDAREAHAWCLAGAPEVTAWLQQRLLSHLDLRLPPLREVAVVRWLADVARRGGLGAITKERIAHGPDAQQGVYQYVHRIDEILQEDLVRGVRTSVDEAFRHAAERVTTAALDRWEEDWRVLAPAPPWPAFRRSCRWLRTPAELVAEGKALGHCVGGYAPVVAQRRVAILSIAWGGERSTAEIRLPGGQVLQHCGPRNGPPSPIHVRILQQVLRRKT
jgi:hypothetical protein